MSKEYTDKDMHLKEFEEMADNAIKDYISYISFQIENNLIKDYMEDFEKQILKFSNKENINLFLRAFTSSFFDIYLNKKCSKRENYN
tara:strand:+ start:695 stop:955 length:261 start_codon:yes stop_codon:yes gene_type:complete